MAEQNYAEFLENHIIMTQPVIPGGVLLAVDIFQQYPLHLELLHPALCFLTHVRSKKREALDGQWKRRSHKNNIVNDLIVQFDIQMTYQAICVLQRVVEDVEEQGQGQGKIQTQGHGKIQAQGQGEIQAQGHRQIQAQGQGQIQAQGHRQIQAHRQGQGEI
ncbi:unnamed protein product [Cochlearia groenlandica]